MGEALSGQNWWTSILTLSVIASAFHFVIQTLFKGNAMNGGKESGCTDVPGMRAG